MENARVILSSRPGANGTTDIDHFAFEKCQMPDMNVKTGHVVIENRLLSIDPALRCRLNESTGVEYISPIEVGTPIMGLGGIGRVVRSASDRFVEGEMVMANLNWPWIKYFDIHESHIIKIPVIPDGYDETVILSVIGLVGLTVLLAFDNMDAPCERARNICVVSAAAGACGILAGQIARNRQKYKIVIGICGSDEKCKCIKENFGYTHVINYKTDDIDQKLGEICSSEKCNIDLYFDNVGGTTSEAVTKHMAYGSQIIVCGQIADYNKDVPYPPPISKSMEKDIALKAVQRQRYLVLNYTEQFESATEQLYDMLANRIIMPKCTVYESLENAGKAFVGMMKGENIGKTIVKI